MQTSYVRHAGQYKTRPNSVITRYGERISFRSPNYTTILNAMRSRSTLTLADMREITGISITAIQKILDRLIAKKYVERAEREGGWRVFLTQ